MARRVGGVAIIDTPEFMMALPLPPNRQKIKGFGGHRHRIWGVRAVGATPARVIPRIRMYDKNISRLSVRYAGLHRFTRQFTLRLGKFLYNATHN
jgi:hypothetical protein